MRQILSTKSINFLYISILLDPAKYLQYFEFVETLYITALLSKALTFYIHVLIHHILLFL